MTRRLSCVLLALALAAQLEAAEAPRLHPPSERPRRGDLAEFRVDGVPKAANPFDPATVRVDAEVVTPSGRELRVPAFHATPHEPHQPPTPARVVSHARVFLTTQDMRQGEAVAFLLDDLALVDTNTGDRVSVDAFEGALAWQTQQTQVSAETKQVHGGTQALRLEMTVDKKHRWPGMSRDVGGADWSRFEELRLWACPLWGVGATVPCIEFYTTDGRKFQTPIHALEGARAGEWVEFAWKLPSTKPPLVWTPSGAPGWRLRLRPQEMGDYRIRARVAVPGGESVGPWQTVAVARGKTLGYAGISTKDRRYLALRGERPLFLNGINLIGRDLGTYEHYVGKLASHGGNFIRIWTSPRTMGIETKASGPRRYDQGRAAQLDALFDLCAAKGVFVMACISDFREVDARHPSSDWANSPYNAANGGPCARPEQFFSDATAKEQYRAKLRYLVARIGHSPRVLAWEFFNEVNITDGWRKVPDAVRAWHREMGDHLRSIDPQQHLITSSFAGIEDDPLWTQPRMEIAQRHQYHDSQLSFVDVVAEAHATLRRHGKPVLMGEFGRRKNRYAALDRQGLSLHNGMWAAMMSGGCGTAMGWWWQWMDEHDLWPQFRAIATFVDGIDWPAEGFEPKEGAAIMARPDPRHGFGSVTFAPKAGGFKPGPANQPVTLRLLDEKLDAPEKLPRFLHGLRNHRDLHNPVTFRVDLPTAGQFAVAVDGVSGHGGATLELSVDGKLASQEAFPDPPDDDTTITKHNGPHAIAVPAGQHTLTVENKGTDWVRVRSYAFSTARTRPPVRVLTLRGRRTVLAWVWNESHAWYAPVVHTPRLVLGGVAATLDGLAPGACRVRPFDPWTGKWGQATDATVGAAGTLRLSVGELKRDRAFRIERIGE